MHVKQNGKQQTSHTRQEMAPPLLPQYLVQAILHWHPPKRVLYKRCCRQQMSNKGNEIIVCYNKLAVQMEICLPESHSHLRKEPLRKLEGKGFKRRRKNCAAAQLINLMTHHQALLVSKLYTLNANTSYVHNNTVVKHDVALAVFQRKTTALPLIGLLLLAQHAHGHGQEDLRRLIIGFLCFRSRLPSAAKSHKLW